MALSLGQGRESEERTVRWPMLIEEKRGMQLLRSEGGCSRATCTCAAIASVWLGLQCAPA
eukprot:5919732-Pleurochrysis_carterae.AAC.2